MANNIDGGSVISIYKVAAGLVAGVLFGTYSVPSFADAVVPQVFLVQNSGWMLPFYDDPNSRFRDLVVELSERVRQYGGGQQIIASFNQTWGENKSPRLHFKGDDQNKVREAIQSIHVAQKPGKSTYADTDFKEAIIGAIRDFSPGQSCLIWIVTNNKNSPDNSTETVQKNKDFYHFLLESDEIRRIVAFPYAMKVRSKLIPGYQSNGLMIYALAYGDPADQVLQKMLSLNAPFGKQSARLKPLDSEALTFIPKGVKGGDGVTASLPDHKTLVLAFDAASKPDSAEIVGQLRNDFYPYDIRAANISIAAGFKGGKEGITAQLSSNTIDGIPTGGMSPEIAVKISVPPIPSPWDTDVIFGSGYKAAGIIRFDLENQQLEISPDFIKLMAEIFPGDPLPELFFSNRLAKHSSTVQPLLVQVAYPSWPLLVVGTIVLLLVGGGIGSFVVLRREKIFKVSVDGVQKSYSLKPFGEVAIKGANGERIGVLKRGLGNAVPMLDKGKSGSVRVM